MLNEAYTKRLSLLHGFISIKQKSQTSKPRKKAVAVVQIDTNGNDQEVQEDISIFDLVSSAKSDGVDIVQRLQEYISVMEVAV